MRSLLLLLVVMLIAPTALILPHLGVLTWTWISIMNPHRLSWGIASGIPLVLLVALLTMAAMAFSGERKFPPMRPLIVIALGFTALTTITSFTALHPEHSWPLWERNSKTLLLFFVAAALINSKVRLQSLLWIIAISLGFFAAKGVLETLSSGGKNVLAGPPNSMLEDNNHLALSLVMLMPILNYLRVSSANKLVRLAVTAVMAFSLIAVLTSYSRGALIALVFGMLAFLRSARGRILMLTLLAAVGLITINVMPEKWRDRVMTMESVETVQQDASFSSRLDAWYVSWRLALSHPFTGGGYSAVERPETFIKYLPEATRGRAAHSVYFQVLGDHGFIGLGLYLTMLLTAWLHLRRTQRRTRHRPHDWDHQMAKMLEIALLVFCIGGAAISIAYHDLILLILMTSMNLDLASARKFGEAETGIVAANQDYRPQT